MKLTYRVSVALGVLAAASAALHSASAAAQTPPPAAAAPPADATPPGSAPAQPSEAGAATAAAPADTALGEPLPALPPEGLPLPVYEPPKEAPKPGQAPSAEAEADKPAGPVDEIKYSGYLPGYRSYFALGEGPSQPSVGSRPGVTPGFGAPLPPNQWTFSFNGYASLSAQVSFDERKQPEPDQSALVTHVTPATIDSYMLFTTTSAVPGNWVNLRFRYGTARVSTNFSVDTYNPTAPTTFYQMGSQFFINNAFLSYSPAPIGDMGFQIDVGRMGISHGQLSRYGNGIYSNLISALIQGNGMRAQSTYDLTPEFQLVGEWDLMTTQDGTLPAGTVRSQDNGWRRQMWAGSVINGLHLGFNSGKEPRYEARVRFMTNRAREDRLTSGVYDDPTTRGINERTLKDGTLNIYAADFKMLNNTWGVLGVGVSYTDAANVFPLRGLVSYGGNGEELTERFLGVESGGTGNLTTAGINYNVNLRPVMGSLQNVDMGTGPNVDLNLGAQYSVIGTERGGFDGKSRFKMGADVVAQLSKYIGIAVRGDHVAPSSQDSGQTFQVLAPRILLKTDWYSRETLQIMYAKWFFGPRTRNEGTGERSQEQLDDTLFALNLNMWW